MNSILIANDMTQNTTLSVGKQLLLPNPTKDPTKKSPTQLVNKSTSVTKKPVPSQTPVKKTPASTKNQSREQQNITYGDYSLALKVNK